MLHLSQVFLAGRPSRTSGSTRAFLKEIIGCEGNFECYENSDHRWCQREGELDYESIPDIFALSYLYLGTIGFLTTIFIGSGTVSRSTFFSPEP